MTIPSEAELLPRFHDNSLNCVGVDIGRSWTSSVWFRHVPNENCPFEFLCSSFVALVGRRSFTALLHPHTKSPHKTCINFNFISTLFSSNLITLNTLGPFGFCFQLPHLPLFSSVQHKHLLLPLCQLKNILQRVVLLTDLVQQHHHCRRGTRGRF